MADIQAFMTGFLGARAQKMQADQAKADDYEDRLRNIALRNQQIAMNREALSNAARGMGDQLLTWGATPEQIQAALKSGQTGLASLYKTVKGVKDTLGEDETKRFLGTVNADIGAAAAVGQEGLGDLYRQTFGLPMGTKVGDYKAPQESTLARLFGATDRKAKMLENLDAELSGVGGYSVYDLTTIGTLPDYLPGSAGESISYSQPTIYSSANFAKEADFVDTRLKDLQNNPDFKFAQEEYNAAAKNLASMKAAEGSEPYKAAQTRLDAARTKITAMQDTAIKQSVLTQASQYFNDEDYLQAIKGHIATAYGFVPSWFTEEEEAAKVATEITNQSLGGGLTDTPPASTDPLSDTQPEVTKPKVVQTVTTEGGEKIEVAEVDGQKVVLNANGQPLPAEASAEILAEIEAMPAFMEKAASRKFGREGDISGYKAMYEGLMELPEEERSTYIEAYQSLSEMPAVLEVVEDAVEATPGFVDNVVGKGAGLAGMGTMLFYKGMANLDAFITGDKARVAKKLVKADQAMETAQEVFADGIVQFLQEKADEAGMTGGFSRARGERIKKALIANEKVSEAVDKAVENPPAVLTRATDTPASKQLQQLIVEQLEIADKEAEKIVAEAQQTSPEEAVDSYVQRMDASQATPSKKEIEDLKTVLELNQVVLEDRPAYTPPAGDVAKAFRKSEANSYGARGLPQQGEVLASNLDALQDIDTPPALDTDGLPELPRNMTVESMLTRRDRGAGLMKRPSVDSTPVKPEMAGSELVALRSTMQRVHGKKSKAIKELDKIVQQAQGGIPIQYTDVNRLLRMTKSLRKSETRDKLIEQLAILANEARK